MLRFVFILMVSSILAFMNPACTVVYLPQVVNAPQLDEQGEIHIGGNVGQGGINFQGAYALSDQVGIMAGGQGTAGEDYFGAALYAGGGYYKTFRDAGRFGAYGGGGLGIGDGIGYGSLFLQPSIGVEYDHFEANFAMRSNSVFYQGGGFDSFIEPVISLRGGIPNLKVQLQGGLSLPVNELEEGYIPFIFSIGLHANLSANQHR